MAETPKKIQSKSISLVTDKALIKWVGDFIIKHQLLGESRKVVCGLSGGADSMLLSHICEGLKKEGFLKSVRHIHIDHGLRSESAKEAFKLKNWALSWFWDFKILKISGRVPKSNIEAWARKLRRHLLLSECKEDEVLFLAHNIDDSFEWFIRQTLGSSQGPLRQGIPLINGLVRRPLHCLSRKQISHFIRDFKIPIIEDLSNKDIRFQRNQIRHQVKRPLLEMFPKGMAHFVERSNQWAEREGLTSYSNKKKESKIESPKVIRTSWGQNVVCLIMKENSRWEDSRSLIIETIQELSDKSRGQIRQNLAKLFATLVEGKTRGPLKFSGGVEVAIYPGCLLILNQKGRNSLCDAISEYNIKTSQIPKVSLEKLFLEVHESKLPFVFFKDKSFGLKGLKSDPYFQDLIDQGLRNKLFFRPISHLTLAATKQDRLNQKISAFIPSL